MGSYRYLVWFRLCISLDTFATPTILHAGGVGIDAITGFMDHAGHYNLMHLQRGQGFVHKSRNLFYQE